MAGSGTSHLRAADDVLLRAEGLVVEYPVRNSRHRVRAVSDVSLDLAGGETLGLVGESGCGKSTIGRAILQLPRPNAGSVRYDGVDLATLSGRRLREYRRHIQMIFQDPLSSLTPRQQIADIVADPLRVWKRGTPAEQKKLVNEVLEAVGLDPATTLTRRPHQFSGGQCQRISIARCLVLDPKIIICDEPVSALDVSVQAQVLNLLGDMKARYGLALLFIAHDLAVVKNISDRIAVMYLGKLCEVAPSEALYRRPAHPYTDLLLRSIPEPDPTSSLPDVDAAAGELPSPLNPPSGCRFRTRCPRATGRCAEEEPVMREIDSDHHVACHHPLVEAVPAAPQPTAQPFNHLNGGSPMQPTEGPVVDDRSDKHPVRRLVDGRRSGRRHRLVAEETISRSASFVLLARTHLTWLGVVNDPYAQQLLPANRRREVSVLRLPGLGRRGLNPSFAYLAARTLFYDEFVVKALDSGIRQVVVVAAGYDSRAWRMARPGVTFFEVDLPATQNDKRSRAPQDGPIYVAADVTEPYLTDRLITAGFRPNEPTAFTVEGLTMYLTEDHVTGLLRTLADLSGPGSRLGVNFNVSFERERSNRAGNERRLMAAGGEFFRFRLQPEDASTFLANAGWTTTRVLTTSQLSAAYLAQTRLAAVAVTTAGISIEAHRST